MSSHPKLKNILYISIPPESANIIGDFQIDPNRLLPLDQNSELADWKAEALSWEMILSGMLKVLAYDPGHEDAAYYRDFVHAAKPNLEVELTEAGIIKAKNQEYDLAEEIFLAVLGLSPDNCRFLLNLALLYEDLARSHQNMGNDEQQMDYEEKAAIWYRRALSLDEVLSDAYLYAGHFFLRQHDLERSRANFELYVKTEEDPHKIKEVEEILRSLHKQDQNDNRFKEAFDFIKMGQEEKGILQIKEFLKNNPDVWNAWFLLGWGLRRIQQYPEALEAFNMALKKGGENPDTLNELAICEMESNNLAQAKKHLNAALRLEPENMKIVSNLGILSIKAGKKDEAFGLFKTVLEYNPEDQIAKKYLEFLEEMN